MMISNSIAERSEEPIARKWCTFKEGDRGNGFLYDLSRQVRIITKIKQLTILKIQLFWRHRFGSEQVALCHRYHIDMHHF
jgi:hypothetical protein